ETVAKRRTANATSLSFRSITEIDAENRGETGRQDRVIGSTIEESVTHIESQRRLQADWEDWIGARHRSTERIDGQRRRTHQIRETQSHDRSLLEGQPHSLLRARSLAVPGVLLREHYHRGRSKDDRLRVVHVADATLPLLKTHFLELFIHG